MQVLFLQRQTESGPPIKGSTLKFTLWAGSFLIDASFLTWNLNISKNEWPSIRTKHSFPAWFLCQTDLQGHGVHQRMLLGEVQSETDYQEITKTKRRRASTSFWTPRESQTQEEKRNVKEGSREPNIPRISPWNASWVNLTDFLKLFFNYSWYIIIFFRCTT